MKVINKYTLNKKNIVVMLPKTTSLMDFAGNYHEHQLAKNRG